MTDPIEELIIARMASRGMTRAEVLERFTVLPCACECFDAPHWAIVPRTVESIAEQLGFHQNPRETPPFMAGR